MEREFHVVTARAIFAYLYDHDMYKLAQEFCMTNPYLEPDRHLMKEGKFPVNVGQKPLQNVMQEFIMMESILLQLVNLFSSAVSFPDTSSILELAEHLIKVVKSSGTGQVLKEVISTLPVCTDWSETQPSTAQPAPPPIPRTVVENASTGPSMPDISFSADNLFDHDLIITASDMSFIETITRCVEPDNMPVVMENTEINGQPIEAVKISGVIPVENVTPVSGMQSNLSSTSTSASTSVVMTSPHQINQPNKQAQHVTLQVARENVPTTTNPPPQIVSNQQVPNVPKQHTEKVPAMTSATRSNATPLDHPIVPGTVSSRSTSSRKQSHIRILDFGTPPYKRGSQSSYGPSRVIPSPALGVPQQTVAVPEQAVSVPKLTPSTSAAVRNLAPVPTANEESKPKKIIVKRRLQLRGMRKRMKRIAVPRLSVKEQRRKAVLKNKTVSPVNMHQKLDTTNPSSNSFKSDRNNVQTKENAYTSTPAPTISLSPGKALRPLSASPPPTVIPGSPACPVDPFAICPMTPRFLTRPLQSLCMLSPLFERLDASAISQIKSISHTKRSSDINTPAYPITPGNTITPSPPPDSVPYYENESGAVDSARKSVDTDSESSVASKSQLTLTASECSKEIAITYVERERMPPAVKNDHKFDEQLSARIEIDNGNRTFQIAVTPIITLYEYFP